MKNVTSHEIVERLRHALETRNNNEFIDQFADNGIFELPFALEGSQSSFEGIDEIRKRFGTTSSMGKLFEIHKVIANVYDSTNPELVIVEFTIKGNSVNTNNAFMFPSSICIITIRDGKIIRYRDFPNSLRGAQVVGMLPQYLASLTN